MSIKISKISSFSFSFKLNEEKKMLLKKLVWRGVYKKILAGRVVWLLIGWLEIFQWKRRAWQGRVGETIGWELWPSKKQWGILVNFQAVGRILAIPMPHLPTRKNPDLYMLVICILKLHIKSLSENGGSWNSVCSIILFI